MHLEVEMGMDPVRVAGVADVGDHLSRRDLGAALQPLRVGDAGDARPLVVVRVGQVVVEMDVEVLGAALAVEVEHAAGARRGRVELDRAGLGGEDKGAARRQHVVPLVRALAARVAEVIRVGRRSENGEDDPRHRRVRCGGRGSRTEQERSHGEEQASGCRPDEGHRVPGSRAKCGSLAEPAEGYSPKGVKAPPAGVSRRSEPGSGGASPSRSCTSSFARSSAARTASAASGSSRSSR